MSALNSPADEELVRIDELSYHWPGYTSRWQGARLMGMKLFGRRSAKRGMEESAPEATPLEPMEPLVALDVDKPLDALATRFMFPLAFQVGEVPVRARPLRLRIGADAFTGTTAGPWFVWKAQSPAGTLSGFWHLPGPEGDEKAAAWQKTAAALATAAAIKLKSSLASLPSTAPVQFSAGPCPAPSLLGKPVFRVDFRYAARGSFREGSAYSPVGYPLVLARATGCDGSAAADDAIATMIAVSKALPGNAPDGYWAERAFRFSGANDRPYLPVYELLNLLSDDDARLVVQNNLVIKAPGAALGALFLFKTTLRTPDAEDRERVEPPHSLDPQRVYPMMPATVFEDGRLSAQNASANLEEFLRRNDEAYEELFQAVRRDALSLSEAGAALIRSVYVAQVYSTKRRAFDAMVTAGRPFDEFKELSEHVARRAVDTSGPETIAAAVYGSAEALAFVQRWCSTRKKQSITDELERIEATLADGTADIGALIDSRSSLLDKAATIVETERREDSAAGAKSGKSRT
ncbi:MAG: hypothetical protein JXM71_06895 [Spirochaetales bacterium]|nr:hypothetical protein [Spirochaetales bacterium]